MAPHRITAARPLPGGVPDGDGWTVSWTGAAVMGIVNVTPDSFSDGGRYVEVGPAVAHGRQLAADGALVVDVGGESTRPGRRAGGRRDGDRPRAAGDRHARRRRPVGQRRHPVGRGRGGGDRRRRPHRQRHQRARRSRTWSAVAATTGTPLVIGHMLGTPATMQDHPTYDDVVAEVTAVAARRGRPRPRRRGAVGARRPRHRVRQDRRAQPGPAAGAARSTSTTRWSSVRRARASSAA